MGTIFSDSCSFHVPITKISSSIVIYVFQQAFSQILMIRWDIDFGFRVMSMDVSVCVAVNISRATWPRLAPGIPGFQVIQTN